MGTARKIFKNSRKNFFLRYRLFFHGKKKNCTERMHEHFRRKELTLLRKCNCLDVFIVQAAFVILLSKITVQKILLTN